MFCNLVSQEHTSTLQRFGRVLISSSPDLSPIEEAFSKIKTVLRGIGARTREDLHEAIEYAITTVTASDASGWFWHCGYQVPNPPKQRAA
jgi:hypothetical protein